jgi:hypothetical protein
MNLELQDFQLRLELCHPEGAFLATEGSFIHFGRDASGQKNAPQHDILLVKTMTWAGKD